MHIPYDGNFHWTGIPARKYKTEGAHFQDITRQILFDDPGLACQLRYFEIEPGGHSTLERHQHIHAVMILRGRGQTLLGHSVIPVQALDLLQVPSMVWHQFRATEGEHLGFLCLVNCDRDRPIRPTEAELAELRRHPEVADFIRV